MIEQVIDEIVRAEADAAAVVQAADEKARKLGAEAVARTDAIQSATDAEIKKLTMRAAAEADNAAAAEARVVFERAEREAERITASGESKLSAAADFIVKTVLER